MFHVYMSFSSTINQNDNLTLLHICSTLGLHTITCIDLVKKQQGV